jgi:hypothetical protein
MSDSLHREPQSQPSPGSHPGEGAAPSPKKKRSGSETRKRQPRIIVRVSPEERAEIKANAEAAGLSVGSYVRSVTTLRQRTRPVRSRPLPDQERLAQFLGQTGRIGGNMYQLVRGMNLGDIPRVDELYDAAKEARAFIAAAREAFGL